MSAQLEVVVDEGLWGYCTQCELWRYSDGWRADDEPTDGYVSATCPVCGSLAYPVEVRREGVARLMLELDLPPGAELPILP